MLSVDNKRANFINFSRSADWGMRRPILFTAPDLTRAIKAALRAGLPIASVRIEPSGAIIILPGKPEDVAPSPPLNPWDAP